MQHQDYRPENDESQLDALFTAYRAACPDTEPGPDFMPGLWQKIEARERVSILFGRWTRNWVTVALALSMVMGLAVAVSRSHNAALPSETYVEVLAEDRAREDLGYFEPVQITPAADQQH